MESKPDWDVASNGSQSLDAPKPNPDRIDRKTYHVETRNGQHGLPLDSSASYLPDTN
jgi:hypothetical protein